MYLTLQGFTRGRIRRSSGMLETWSQVGSTGATGMLVLENLCDSVTNLFWMVYDLWMIMAFLWKRIAFEGAGNYKG